jgi:hypothetical protein
MLFPSTLIISENLDSISQILVDLGHTSILNDPDIYQIFEYTVENIRTINNFLSRSPYSHQNKIVIIPSAHLLNLESQNTLLKNLEEPGEGNYFILQTSRPNSLISTILSRCHIIRSSYGTVSNRSLPILNFPNTIPQSLVLADTLPHDKTDLQNYLNDQIYLYQQQLIVTPNLATSKIINKLLKALALLDANVDCKSTIDFLLLS